MICGILPFKFCYSNSFSGLYLSMCMDVRRGFFLFFDGGLAVYQNCPQTFFSAENLKTLQGYHSSAEGFDGNARPLDSLSENVSPVFLTPHIFSTLTHRAALKFNCSGIFGISWYLLSVYLRSLCIDSFGLPWASSL